MLAVSAFVSALVNWFVCCRAWVPWGRPLDNGETDSGWSKKGVNGEDLAGLPARSAGDLSWEAQENIVYKISLSRIGSEPRGLPCLVDLQLSISWLGLESRL